MRSTNDLEKILVFLISSAVGALSLLVINAFLNTWIILGNLYFNAYTSAVFVSLGLNVLILGILKIHTKLMVKDNINVQFILSFAIAALAYSIYTFLIQPKFKLINFLGASIVSFDTVLVQYLINKYANKVLSKDF